MNEQEKLWGSPANFEATYNEIANYYHEKGLELKPLYTQDGSEIHKTLEGVTFNFWGIPGSEQDSKIVVNFEGRTDDQTLQLTGGVYNSFSEAKEDLRIKAQEIFSSSDDNEHETTELKEAA